MRNIFLKRKSTFSVLLSAILLLCTLSAPASADTLEPTVSEPFDDDTHIALVQNFLDNNNIDSSDWSEYNYAEVISSNGNESSALCLTTTEDDIVKKDIILMVGEDKDGNYTPIDIQNTLEGVSTLSGSSADYPPESWDGRYIIHGTAVYNLRYNSSGISFYQPTGCYFTYKKINSSVTVSYISVKYICDGIVYTYPGFSNQNYEEVFTIQVARNNPAVNTMYSKTQNYSSSKVLMTHSGSPMVGNFLTFNATVNGTSDDYTVVI